MMWQLVSRLSRLCRQCRMELILFVLLSAVMLVRFSGLTSWTPGFFVDESSIAYNALTIARFGQDEHGVAWPIYFKAFGEYKNPLFVYLQALFFTLLGPSPWVARFESAVFVIAAGFVFAALVAALSGFRFEASWRGLMSDHKLRSSDGNPRSGWSNWARRFTWSLRSVSHQSFPSSHWPLKFGRSFRPPWLQAWLGAWLLAAVFFLTLPWTFALGRVSFEVALYPLVFFSASWALWQFEVRQSDRARSLAWLGFHILMGLLFYTYTVGRFIAPVLVVAATVIWLRRLRWQQILAGWTVFGLLLLPVVLWQSQNPDTLLSRYSMVAQRSGEWWQIVTAYLKHFSPDFLFARGDGNYRHGLIGTGLLWWSTVPLIGLGARALWQKPLRRYGLWLLVGLMLSPVPGMLTIPSPHTLRSITQLLLLTLVAGVGLLEIYKKMSELSNLRLRAPELAGVFYQLVMFLILALVLEAGLAYGQFFSKYAHLSRAWYEADLYDGFSQVIGRAGAPYYLSAEFYPGSSATARFLYGVRESVTSPAQLRSAVVESFFNQQFLIDLSAGTVMLSAPECTRYKSILETYYQKMWQSSENCAWERN